MQPPTANLAKHRRARPTSRRAAWTLPILIVGILIATTAFGNAHAQSEGDEVVLSVDPSQGPAGTTITASTNGWHDDMSLQFGAWDTEVTYDAANEEVSFEVPDVSEGDYYLVVRDDGVVVQRYCCFTVVSDSSGSGSSQDDSGGESNASGSEDASPEQPNEECRERGVNLQCNEWGWIRMDSQMEMRGEPLPVHAEFQLNENLANRDGRWVLISLRNVTGLDEEPISFRLEGLKTPHGDVFTTEVDHEEPNVLDLWVHVVDVPTGVPISLDATVASAERGAFRIEVLILGFDRGYEPIKSSDGEDLSLFSFSLLGVNQATGENALSGSSNKLVNVPAPGIALVAGPLLALALVAGRWRR